MSWNKEKIVFALSLLALGVTIAFLGAFGSLGGESYDGLIRDPQPAGQFSPLEEEIVDWYAPRLESGARDPFLPISEWKAAPPDPMPLPRIGELTRRVPLPGALAKTTSARPPRERERPEAVGGEQP